MEREKRKNSGKGGKDCNKKREQEQQGNEKQKRNNEWRGRKWKKSIKIRRRN